MAEHTPGPWRSGWDDATLGWCVAAGDGGEVVAYVPEDLEHVEVTAANLELVAAAPELLAALQGLLSWVDGDPIDPDTGEYETRPADAARRAIAKATGKEG
jgi:hypothetical protein